MHRRTLGTTKKNIIFTNFDKYFIRTTYTILFRPMYAKMPGFPKCLQSFFTISRRIHLLFGDGTFLSKLLLVDGLFRRFHSCR